MEAKVLYAAALLSLVALTGCSRALPVAEAPPVQPQTDEDLGVSSGVGALTAEPGDFVEMTWTDTPREVAPRRVIQTTRAVKPTMATGKKTELFALPQGGGAAFTAADADK